MKFSASDGRLFTLTVERYEHPDEELGPTEDNPADEFDRSRFLIVAHEFCDGKRSWQARFPTMTTEELANFADWLSRIQHNDFSVAGVNFTERCLEIGFDQQSDSLVVLVFYEFLPLGYLDRQEIAIYFPRQEVDLAAAIKSLRQQLAAFPGRPPLA